MYRLLHCEDAMVIPSIVTSSNGDPLANMARPPEAAWAASAEHSALEVGLERGKMMGWSLISAMASSISVLKRPLQAMEILEAMAEINDQP